MNPSNNFSPNYSGLFFGNHFNLKSLSGLPTLAEIRDIGTINAELDLVEPGSEASVETSAEENAESSTGVDFAANDVADEMAATGENELDPELGSELEGLPPMEEATDLKAASVADTA